ncbi:GxxExxY protein [Thiohalophilus sp.]|uniref:GxxExxY protein n=1 Tax=Thiohalophilus sp. TaxID=3028392 RepID=UPI002ACDEA7E|nr:GxxExxY protein [Thiohalophilus sp.]MDZ7662795.1 GxxExxY protein [Thiohalophilus sp.]
MSHELHENHEKILFKEESYQIQGAIFEVYNEIGPGFLEAVYQECLEYELGSRKIPFTAQKELAVSYKGRKLNQTYKPDLVCYDKIIVEIKSVRQINNEHQAQILNYLKATGLNLGLLVNFGSYPRATIKRFVS